jgi:hypothetical protein
MSNGAISNARNAVIKLTGTITGNQVVTIPTAIEKTYIISNGTTGAFTVEFKTAGGTGVTFGTTDKSTKILFVDGTNVVDTGTVSLTGVQTLTNKTLTSPIINEIDDTNSNEQIKFTTTASAVNEFTITNAATGNAPEISATGSDTNIDLKITPKGSGKINLDGIKFPNADGSSGQFLQTDGSGNLSFAAAGIAWQAIITGATLTAVSGRGYWIDTTSNACTVTLPASATNGDTIILADYARKWATNAVTINQNSLNFQGNTSPNPVYNTEGQSVTLVYSGATQGWIPTVDDAVTLETPQPYSINFLVVGGGGSGGAGWGGGGGAGGFRTSTQTASIGTVITVTVGDGGAAQSSRTRGNNGTASSISGSGLTTISSAGGGAGNCGNVELGAANSGGSGGGGAGDAVTNTGGSGNTPSTSPSQGNNGGNGTSGGPYFPCGGGGGASAVGTNGSNSISPFNGFGGNGTASSITGSSVTYAGGGGAGAYDGTGGSGGTGGGGAGGTGGAGIAGTANTGGGGGGGAWIGSAATSGAGGKGVVILSVPTVSYSATSSGSPTITTSGSNTILQFNGSGTYTA